MASETYDVVIVGCGTAGLVLAARLSEDASLQVAVIEPGNGHETDPQVLTPGAWMALTNSPLDWAFKTVPQKELGNRVLDYPQGRALGGTSTINSFLFAPPSRTNIDAWAGLGNNGWDFDAYSEALKRAYTFHDASGATAGSGPLQLSVYGSEPVASWCKAWVDCFANLGFTSSDPFSGEVCGALSNVESIDPGKKQRSSSATAYLAPASDRPNLTVLTGSYVSKLLLSKTDLDGVVAEGVQIVTGDGATKHIKARREVILAAGALNSPRILETSGIGDPDLLRKLGIEVMVENPHVGENLQNHTTTPLIFDVRDDQDTLDAYFRQEPAAVAEAQEAYSKDGGGPLGTSLVSASAQLPFPGIRTSEGREDLSRLLDGHLDLEADPRWSPRTTPAFAEAHASFVQSNLSSPTEASGTYFMAPAGLAQTPGNHITVVAMVAHPLSRGHAHITSASPDNLAGSGGVEIDQATFSHPLDLEVLARQLRFVEEALTTTEPVASLLKPREALFGDLEAAREYARAMTTPGHHFTGTCAMMPRDMGGVVDDKLQVYGCRNLRVCDASVVPIIPRANTQAVVYGVAEMGAKIFKEAI
ncbi:related to alcohol oxidase [Cephalotrichum gorgonifer]|uniref:Related to alcohol oxidase n=1 Tax=Cephalotrichum gorgonifer TaxID=2041049 RepID=A0AAE8SXZ7_9PEZI|nr:related to alcohol oxidase [Cephalotrichum gorgonifer]